METAAKGSGVEVAKPSFNWTKFTKLFRSEAALVRREILCFGVFTCFFYALGTKYHQIGVHFFHPNPSKWTDAELGIPPDNED
ncbi:NADH dehydrogenase [ubiquinone] 1 beta subcomplex subunit 2, mitochondrial-like [Mizuhopecten yessoensis]|uniref:NADH dehydrogenase [ubiquinone] 1 beta subcomplex subunit 2, mitochondrial-like n=1 Tax=Mizuhopecten yessoensis TaxID=6573 RepID=UPI000B45D4EE|nr:NADH dehydrogenase [ubiquinone] 1 beta subcomplex subunit 2, mitochondrial-like [Mizuhopecten yessoensis]